MNITYSFKDQLPYLTKKESKEQNATKKNNFVVTYLIKNISYLSKQMRVPKTKMKELVIK